jgi:hypothetical protein
MVSLEWSNVLSTLLPGALALFALVGFSPRLYARILDFEHVGTVMGFALLMAAVLIGELLGVFTRLVWERYWLIPHCNPPDALKSLRAENLDLYDRGVKNNYKYATFYANFAWATILLIASRFRQGDKACSAVIWFLMIATVILLRGSHVQWTYFVNYLRKVFAERNDDARQRPASGDGN